MHEARELLKRIHIELFKTHTNLLAARVCISEGRCVIKFTVPCKGFIPACDRIALPKRLGKYKTIICSGWTELCGKDECNSENNRVQASISISPKPLSLYDSETCTDPSFGTLGGFLRFRNRYFGVTAGHVFIRRQSTTVEAEVDNA